MLGAKRGAPSPSAHLGELRYGNAWLRSVKYFQDIDSARACGSPQPHVSLKGPNAPQTPRPGAIAPMVVTKMKHEDQYNCYIGNKKNENQTRPKTTNNMKSINIIITNIALK